MVSSSASILLIYMGVWLAATTVISLVRRNNEESRVAVSPLVVAFKSSLTFERFERLRGNRLVGVLLDAGILVLIIIMILSYYMLLKNILSMLLTGRRVGVVTPIIPGVTISIDVFLYMLPGLVVAVLLHEAFHALAARYEGIPVRSSGLMIFLGLIPAAFVEPDEEALMKAPRRTKLRVYSAGVLANTILFIIFAGIMAGLAQGGYYMVVQAAPKGPAAAQGLPQLLIVKEIKINGTSFDSLAKFITYIEKIRSTHNGSLKGVTLDIVFVTPSGKEYRINKPANADAIGIYLAQIPRSLAVLGATTAMAVYLVLLYAQLLNIGLAGINAIPLFISDGAQFIKAVFEPSLGPERSQAIANIASAITLLILLPGITL